MQIPGTKIVLPLPIQTSGKSLLQNLQPGQILQGTALSDNINDSIRLQIGVTRLIAQTTMKISTGQRLTLQVEKVGNLPELRVLTLPSQTELKSAALKNVLPRQQPLPQLLKTLTRIVAGSSSASPLPPPVKLAINSLLMRIISIDDTAFKVQISKALQLSGTQSEARLLNQNIETTDFKLNLLRLIGLIKPLISQGKPLEQTILVQSPQVNPAPIPTPTATASREASATTKLLFDLFKHLDGAVARIQTNQLSSLPTEDPARQVWQFELPIRQGNAFDLFHFRIARDGSKSGKESETAWNLTLHMNLLPLGPMKIRLHLIGEVISTVIWSEMPDTTSLIKRHLGKLRTGLESAGLEVKKLDAFQGSAKIKNELPNEHSLLNEKA
ncbi:MAG: flagellar hook-length control protein FliK [Candidatus Thiodiazotropha sp. (ex Ustalcina ferruginea)]|nr:flagellar hook-length control protein FliK [Candidatus Thiodiazotropha sp. (ex Ustalcina ferruginea)]